MRKVQFGSGGNIIAGWENYDQDIDISKKLPFADKIVDLIFAEHVVEHITSCDAYRFLEECYRILKPGGEINIIVPDPTKIEKDQTEAYNQFNISRGWGENPIRSIFVNHGHYSAWTIPLLETAIRGVGFKINNESSSFNGCSGHGKSIGEDFNRIESISIIGLKDHAN